MCKDSVFDKHKGQKTQKKEQSVYALLLCDKSFGLKIRQNETVIRRLQETFRLCKPLVPSLQS